MRLIRFLSAAFHLALCCVIGHQFCFRYTRNPLGRVSDQWPGRTRGFVTICGNCGMEKNERA